MIAPAAQARVAQERQHRGDPAVGELLRAQAELGEDQRLEGAPHLGRRE